MDPLARRQMIAHVQVERQRLLPEHEQATRTTIEMLRASTGHASDPQLVPYLNLAYLLGVKNTYGDDQLMALALSVANWATTAVSDLAHHTGRTPQQIIDQYETDIIADQEDLT
ncbi:hypothetical protein ACFVZD_18965 [Streptomyces sp. NPDC058287]|uniref:hypothetical protein n=1 Tax=unclassified Streptomyces TaxID=2593676 RepID=UPI0036E85F03